MILSFAFVYEHESSIGGYKGPTMYKGEHESSICGYKGPTMFWPRPFEDFGSGLGEFRDFPGPQHLFCVSLGTSQVLWHSFGFVMYLFGFWNILGFIWVNLELVWLGFIWVWIYFSLILGY
jgi:hypothetical protein